MLKIYVYFFQILLKKKKWLNIVISEATTDRVNQTCENTSKKE